MLVDTLRADRLAAEPHPAAPRLAELARRGVLFEQAVSVSAWTLPAVVGLLSGRFPTAAVFRRGELLASLVEPLRDAGFRTAALTEGGYVSDFFGLDRGFEHFLEGEGPVRLRIDGQQVNTLAGSLESTFGMAARWLRANARQPFFLLVHSYEVHVPYGRPSRARELPRGVLDPTYQLHHLLRVRRGEIPIGPTESAYLSALYDGGVAAVDGQVGGLLDLLEELGVADSTLVVVTSDHGEEFGERFPTRAGDHGHSLYDELIRIPLVVYDPGRDYPVRRVAAQVRIVDVLPTVLERLGVPAPEGLDGRSLLPLMEGAEQEDRLAVQQLERHGPALLAARGRGHKLIRSTGPDPAETPLRADAPPLELYDLRSDPGERDSRPGLRPPERPELEAWLAGFERRLAAEGAPDFRDEAADPALRERLEALGYVDPSARGGLDPASEGAHHGRPTGRDGVEDEQ